MLTNENVIIPISQLIQEKLKRGLQNLSEELIESSKLNILLLSLLYFVFLDNFKKKI